MVIKFTPSLEIKMIFKAIFSKISSGNPWKNSSKYNNISFYSRGAWALYNGVIQALELKGKKKGAAWFPDYFCNEALIPLRGKGIDLNFYPINRNLEPDWEYIENKLKNNYSVDIFVLVHYFGFIFPLEKATKICKKHNMILIEDGAHVLKKKNPIGNNFSIYSSRKIFPLPEIGILVSNTPKNKINYSQINLIFFIWFFKCLIQNILSKLNVNWHSYNLKNNNNNNGNSIPNQRYPSIFSLRLLNLYENRISIYGQKRINNYLIIERSIKRMSNIKPLFNKLPQDNIPYVFPIIVTKKYSLIKNELVKIGIPATSWNDMPPEVEESFKIYDYAIYLSKSLLLLPIHHSIGITEINFMVDSLKNIINKLKD